MKNQPFQLSKPSRPQAGLRSKAGRITYIAYLRLKKYGAADVLIVVGHVRQSAIPEPFLTITTTKHHHSLRTDH